LKEWGWQNPTFEQVVWRINKLPTKDVTFGSSQPEIRKTRHLPGISFDDQKFMIQFGNEDEDGQIAQIYPTRFQTSLIDCDWVFEGTWDLYITEEGGFTKPQTFSKETSHHFATAFLFPPARYSPFEGGDLILRSSNETTGIVKIEPSKFKKWTYVAFHLSVEYECTPVTKGCRLVFKDYLELPDEPYFFNNTTITSVPTDLKRPIIDVYRKEEIKRLEEKIQKLKERILDLQEARTSLHVREIVEQIRQSKTNALVVLGNKPDLEPIDFEGEEAFLWNAIIAEWPYSTFRRCKAYRFEGRDDLNILNEKENELYEEEKGKVILFHKITETGKPTEQSANDLDDEIIRLTVPIICVQKERMIIEDMS
jgi:hypothetical protein